MPERYFETWDSDRKKVLGVVNDVMLDIINNANDALANVVMTAAIPTQKLSETLLSPNITVLFLEEGEEGKTLISFVPTPVFVSYVESAYKTFSSVWIQHTKEFNTVQGYDRKPAYGGKPPQYGKPAEKTADPEKFIADILTGIRWSDDFENPVSTREIWTVLKGNVSWKDWMDFIEKYNNKEMVGGIYLSFKKEKDKTGKYWWNEVTLLGGTKP